MVAFATGLVAVLSLDIPKLAELIYSELHDWVHYHTCLVQLNVL